MNENKVTAILSVYNEEPRLGKVLKALSASPLIEKVIVVNDASTDQSSEEIKKYQTSKVKVIENKKNIGKGASVRMALEFVETGITFTCDADTVGLNETEIEKILKPVISGEYDACLGVVYIGGPIIQFFRRFIMVLTGERAVKTQIYKDVMKSPYTERWGIESYMNFYFRHHPVKVKKVDIYVDTPMHMQKVGFGNWLSDRLLLFSVMYFKILILELKTLFGIHE